jgi:hypothetical protein
MQFAKPTLQRAQVVVRDPDTGKSKSFTVYGVTPEQFCTRVRRQFRDEEGESGRPKPGRQTKATSPA